MTYFTYKDAQRAKIPKRRTAKKVLSLSTTIAQNAITTHVLDLDQVNQAFNNSMKRYTPA